MSAQQLSILDAIDRSRSGDPQSSKRAEREIKRSGTLRGQAQMVLGLIKRYPGRSTKELSELGTLDRYQIARRSADLKRLGLVKAVAIGSSDLQWWPR